MPHTPVFAGQRSTADDWTVLADWDTYTPQLQSTGTDPSLGASGEAVGFWWRTGHEIYGGVRFSFSGSGIDPGSGNYRITLPFPSHSFYDVSGHSIAVGSGRLRDNSDGTNSRIVTAVMVGDRLGMVHDGTQSTASATFPIAWAAGDRISIRFHYLADPASLSMRDPGLWLNGADGNYASTPDSSSLSVTGDIDLRAEGTLDDWATGSTQTLIGKYVSSGDQRSHLLQVIGDGSLRIIWSTDGTSSGASIIDSTAAVPASAGDRLAVRVQLDVDDGSGGWAVTFYTAPSISGPWTQLGSPVDNAGGGTTSVHAGTADLSAGAHQEDGSGSPATGVIHAAEVRDGIDGTVVADPVFEEQPYGTGSFVDAAGNAWTVQGNARIYTHRWVDGGLLPALVSRNLDSVRPYTPVLSADTTNPDLGRNGIARGWWRLSGAFVQGAVTLQFSEDGTVDAGSGTYYRVSKPLPHDPALIDADGTNDQAIRIGDGSINDVAGSGTENQLLVVQLIDDTGEMWMGLEGTNIGVNDSTPKVWSNGDAIALRFAYPADPAAVADLLGVAGP